MEHMKYADIVVNNQSEVVALMASLEAQDLMEDFTLLKAAQDAYAHYFLGERPLIKDPTSVVASVWNDVKALSGARDALKKVKKVAVEDNGGTVVKKTRRPARKPR